MRCWNRSCDGGVVQLNKIEDGIVELHGGQRDLCGGGGRHRCRHFDLGAAAIMDHSLLTVSGIFEVLLDGASDNVEFLFLPPSGLLPRLGRPRPPPLDHCGISLLSTMVR